MPKYKESVENFNKRMVKEHKVVLTCDEKVLFCKMCDTPLAAKQLFQVTQHLQTGKHLASVKRKEKQCTTTSQALITTMPDPNVSRNLHNFNMDIAKLCLEVNIPLHRVGHPTFKKFIETHTMYAAPSVTKLREKCVPKVYENCINKMKSIADDKFIWVAIDETTDCEERYVANFVFGLLGEEDEITKSYLFASKQLQVTNSNSIGTFFNDCVTELGE